MRKTRLIFKHIITNNNFLLNSIKYYKLRYNNIFIYYTLTKYNYILFCLFVVFVMTKKKKKT